MGLEVGVVLEERRDELVQRSHILCTCCCLWEKDDVGDGKKTRAVGKQHHPCDCHARDLSEPPRKSFLLLHYILCSIILYSTIHSGANSPNDPPSAIGTTSPASRLAHSAACSVSPSYGSASSRSAASSAICSSSSSPFSSRICCPRSARRANHEGSPKRAASV